MAHKRLYIKKKRKKKIHLWAVRLLIVCVVELVSDIRKKQEEQPVYLHNGDLKARVDVSPLQGNSRGSMCGNFLVEA